MISNPAILAPDEKLLLRPESVARMLDISPRTLRQWIAAEKFPPPDIQWNARMIFWKRETIVNWVELQGR